MSKNKKYVFVTPKSTSLYEEDKPQPEKDFKFYQVAIFPNPKTARFEIREVLISGSGDIKGYKMYNVNEDTHRKFIRGLHEGRYKMYPIYTLESIEFPSCQDIMLAMSGMINDDNEYTGHAKFEGGKEFNWRGDMF